MEQMLLFGEGKSKKIFAKNRHVFQRFAIETRLKSYVLSVTSDLS